MKKPWEELSEIEKREAIARRLGWFLSPLTKGDERPQCKSPDGLWRLNIALPDWPTNDGLAFTEVWPKITERLSATLYGSPVGRKNLRLSDAGGFKNGCTSIDAGTWAEAICRAAYELLPETV